MWEKMMKRCAVFSCLGLGDGLIAMVLSNNLRRNGVEVTTFHPFMEGLQAWFPHLPIRRFPSMNELAAFDAFFIFYEKTPRMQEVLDACQKQWPEKTFVLNPIPTKNRDYPYWEVGQFDGRFPLVDNLVAFCQRRLQLRDVVKANGICAPRTIERAPGRVIVHPAGSRASKDWQQKKFLALADLLQKEGYEPLFVLHEKERSAWDTSRIQAPVFADLSAVAEAVCAAEVMIGNDSGIGHLASCLGVPTLTICRRKQYACFSRPAWTEGKVVTPYGWIPNIKGWRLRDKYWKHWISVQRVLKAFHHIA
jgi:hypothetical protein